MAIASCQATNEYFMYLVEPWNCTRIKSARYGQNPLQYTFATGPKRPYSTRSSASTGPSFRLSWQVMARPCQHTLQKNLTSILNAEDLNMVFSGSGANPATMRGWWRLAVRGVASVRVVVRAEWQTAPPLGVLEILCQSFNLYKRGLHDDKEIRL